MIFRCILAVLLILAVSCAGSAAEDYPVILSPDEMEQSLTGSGGTAPPAPAASATPAAGIDESSSTPSSATAESYDALPLRFSEMSQYDRIAMEPFQETYDDLPLPEKAELYAKQFVFMNNRSPIFPPEIVEAISRADEPSEPAENESPRKRKRSPPRKKGRNGRTAARDAHEDSPEAASDPVAEAMAYPGPYDPLPKRMSDMGRHDRIAMEPYRETYDDLPLAEQADLYAKQFSFMNDRPPRFHPSIIAEIHGLPYEPRGDEALAFVSKTAAAPVAETAEIADVVVPEPTPEPVVRPSSGAGSLRPPPPEPPKYDDFPRRMADMTREDRIAMEPHREQYDTLPLTEKAVVYAKQFKRMHGRFPKFKPAVMAEIGLSQYNSVDLEAMGLKEVADSLRSRSNEQYDDLPRTLAEMGTDARNALDVYRFSYDRFSLPEQAAIYSAQFEKLYGRSPRFSPALLTKIDRVRQGLPEEEPVEEGPFSWSGMEGASETLPVRRLPPSGVYDALPRRMSEMTEYDQIAMEPYKETYDTLPLAEKARLYARQFEFMQGRPPIFSPEVEEEMLELEDTPDPKIVKKSNKDFYKQPAGRARKLGMDPAALPGPWNLNAQPGAAAPRGETIVRNPDGTPYQEKDDRLESLRGGWSLFDVQPGKTETEKLFDGEYDEEYEDE